MEASAPQKLGNAFLFSSFWAFYAHTHTQAVTALETAFMRKCKQIGEKCRRYSKKCLRYL